MTEEKAANTQGAASDNHVVYVGSKPFMKSV